jgi:hypothetical protein
VESVLCEELTVLIDPRRSQSGILLLASAGVGCMLSGHTGVLGCTLVPSRVIAYTVVWTSKLNFFARLMQTAVDEIIPKVGWLLQLHTEVEGAKAEFTQ